MVVVANFLKTIRVDAPQYLVTEWKERRRKPGLSTLENAYSTMRQTKGYLAQTAYFMEEILPLLDKTKLDKTDQELFVKAIRVHVGRRYQGLLSVFKVMGQIQKPAETPEAEFPEGEAPEGEAALEGEEGAEPAPEKPRLTSELENEMSIAKSVLEYRGLLPAQDKAQDKGLLLMLNKTIEKMNKNGGGNVFSSTYKNIVGAIAAQVRAEGASLNEALKEVSWPAELPTGVTLDSIGQDEDVLSFAKDFKVPTKVEFPFGLPPELGGEVLPEAEAVEEVGIAAEEEFYEEAELGEEL